MKKLTIIVFLFFLFLEAAVYSYDDERTHRQLTGRAIDSPVLSSYLRNNLGLREGFSSIINGRSISWWLREGAYLEDDPICRASNHFHDPLKPWNVSGMSDQPWFVDLYCRSWTPVYSNITWATGYLSWPPDGAKAAFNTNPYYAPNTWDNARLFYYNALLSISKEDRDLFLAETFKALGQVMHLLQDVSVPAHTRNDFTSHLNYSGYLSRIPTNWVGNRYEHYVKNNPTLVTTAVSQSPSLINPRLTDFWDTNLYVLSGNILPDLSFGIAESTNANYLSDHTIPNNKPTPEHSYAYPIVNNNTAQICEDYEPNSTKKRKYISRRSKGVCPPLIAARTADHFATPSLLNTEYLIQRNDISLLRLWLDENVHNTYAKELLPRAIGYSAGLLQYFFRGSIEIALPPKGVYALTENRDQGFTKVTLMALNTTTTGEEMTDGSIELVVKYRLALEDPFQSYPVPTTWEYSYIVVPELNNTRSIPRANPINLEFDLTQNPIPINATDIYLQVVYKGKLGQEEGAVAVGLKDISEPTPIDIYNDMDRICINGSWYVAGSPEALALGNQFNFDAYPHYLRNIYLRFSPTDNPQGASSTDFNLHLPSLDAGDFFIREAFILTDYQFNYGYRVTVVNADPNDPYVTWFEPRVISYSGVKNQTEYTVLEDPQECALYNLVAPCGIYIRYYPIFNSYRGQEMWRGIAFPNASYPPGSVCP